jgi:hypothetical protein
VWDYAEAGRLATLDTAGVTECIYCRASMLRLRAERFEARTGPAVSLRSRRSAKHVGGGTSTGSTRTTLHVPQAWLKATRAQSGR